MSHFALRMLRLMGLWGCGQRGSAVHQIHRPAGRAQRPRAEPVVLRVDVTEFDIGKADQPVAGLGLDNADRLADQRLADKDQIPRPFNLACGPYPPHRDVAAIGRIFEAVRVGPRRGPVQRRRRLLTQRLVRPLVVVDLAEAVEAPLLRRQAGGRWFCRLVLERAVNSLAPLCSSASQLLRRGKTSRARASPATAPRLPDADPRRPTAGHKPETSQVPTRSFPE